MEYRELMYGFSDLKDLMIENYQIERGREFVKLYFTEQREWLFVHDYDDHKKQMYICNNVKDKKIRKGLSDRAQKLTREALKYSSPAQFLNSGFLLYGFFQS
ncbi:MAG: hypothetical protein H7328_08920 [Bdellovibrio sp.]|nr:hypothetical protein [Bdellovibrio sp.]